MPNSIPHSACHSSWQPTFLRLLPQIRNYAVPAFRQLKGDDHDNAVQEAIAQAFVLFVRLMRKGRDDRVFPTVLARFAIGRVRQGRTLGGRMNSRDVTFPNRSSRQNVRWARLAWHRPSRHRWLEAVIEDHRTPVIDQVWFRIDYPEWLSRLPHRKRQIAEFLSAGNSTNAVARQFRLSAARISQIRRELFESWENFHASSGQDQRPKERSSRANPSWSCESPKSAARPLASLRHGPVVR